jgi:hypothetical protein
MQKNKSEEDILFEGSQASRAQLLITVVLRWNERGISVKKHWQGKRQYSE